MQLGTVDFATGTRHGSIFDMGYEHWWEPDPERGRAVPWTPPELRFEADGKARVQAGFLRLNGWLVNESDDELTVGLFSAPAVFWVRLVESDRVTKRPYSGPPMPPPAPPPPTVLFVPATTRVEFEAIVDLGGYAYAPGTEAELEWTFNFWNEPKPAGRMRIVLG